MPPYRRVAPLLLLACTAACPVPISHTETLSPPVVGVVHKSDGTPVVGAQVAVAYGYARSPCTRATSLATTDSTGSFRLVATQKDYRVVWVIPNLDRFPPSYLLCVGAGDTLLPAYIGRGSLDAEAEPDSVTCNGAWRSRPWGRSTGAGARACSPTARRPSASRRSGSASPSARRARCVPCPSAEDRPGLSNWGGAGRLISVHSHDPPRFGG